MPSNLSRLAPLLALVLACENADDETASATDDPTGGAEPTPVTVPADGCMPICVEDADLATAVLEPSCTVFDNDPAGARVEIQPCEEDYGELKAPAGETVCWAARIDPYQETPSVLDDLDAACVDAGEHFQIFVLRYQPAPADGFVDAVCELAAEAAPPCPGL